MPAIDVIKALLGKLAGIFSALTNVGALVGNSTATIVKFLTQASASNKPPGLSHLFGTGSDTFITRLVNVIVNIPFVFFLGMVIYTGYMWMLGGSNSSNLSKAKSSFFWAVAGLFVSIAAVIIVKMVLKALDVTDDPTQLTAPTFQ